jgi:hypothetical protein
MGFSRDRHSADPVRQARFAGSRLGERGQVRAQVLEPSRAARTGPNHVRHYAKVDPYDSQAAAKIDLPFPFWLGPAKSIHSMLAFKIENADDLDRALIKQREGIAAIAKPLNRMLSLLD